MGYDRGTLLEAGVERAEVLAAVTNGDNTNIVVARTAREHFKVPRVVARIYDPRRAAIYERLGISTVASAQLTTELAVRRVLPDDAGVRWVDPSANVCLVDRTCSHRRSPATRSPTSNAPVRCGSMAVRRLGVGIVATPDLVFQEGDVVYLSVANDQLEAIDGLLNPDSRRPRPARRLTDASPDRRSGQGRHVHRRRPRRRPATKWRSSSGRTNASSSCVTEPISITSSGSSPTPARCHSSPTASPQTADVFVAVTGDDEDNLVSSLLAKQEFGVPRVLARVNHPANEWLFTSDWGIDHAVSAPHLLSGLVQEAVTVGSVVRLLDLAENARLVEVTLTEDAPVVGQQIAQISFPREASVVAILRSRAVVVPRGDTSFLPGDEVLVLVTDESEPAVRQLLVTPSSSV